MADTLSAVTEDLKGKVAEAKQGDFHLNGHTLFLMALIGLGAFAAYVLILKPKQNQQAATTQTSATSGTQPAAFISEPVSIVNEPAPVQVLPTPASSPPGSSPPSSHGPTGQPGPRQPFPGSTGPTGQPGPRQPLGRPTYQVQSGDTLSSIAAREHVSLAALEATPSNYSVIRNTQLAHGHETFTWDLIFPGETLYLPN